MLNVTPRCFWEKVYKTLFLLKTKYGCGRFFILELKIPSWACLLGSGLKLNFHRKVHWLIFLRSKFTSLTEAFTLWTTENKDVSSAKSITLEDKSSAKSWYKLKTTVAPGQILEQLQNEYWSKTNFDH